MNLEKSELVVIIGDHLKANPGILDADRVFIAIPIEEATLFLEIFPGRDLVIRGFIRESDFGEVDILSVFTHVTAGELHEFFCPDTDAIDWNYSMGVSFRGIPMNFRDIFLHFQIEHTITYRDDNYILRDSEILDQYFTISIEDWAS